MMLLGGYVLALHFSLQHEAIHGWRAIPGWLRTAVVWPPIGGLAALRDLSARPQPASPQHSSDLPRRGHRILLSQARGLGTLQPLMARHSAVPSDFPGTATDRTAVALAQTDHHRRWHAGARRLPQRAGLARLLRRSGGDPVVRQRCLRHADLGILRAAGLSRPQHRPDPRFLSSTATGGAPASASPLSNRTGSSGCCSCGTTCTSSTTSIPRCRGTESRPSTGNTAGRCWSTTVTIASAVTARSLGAGS